MSGDMDCSPTQTEKPDNLARLRAAGHDIVNTTDDPEFCWTHNRTGGECLAELDAPDTDCSLGDADHDHHWHYLAFGVEQCCECPALLVSSDAPIIRSNGWGDPYAGCPTCGHCA